MALLAWQRRGRVTGARTLSILMVAAGIYSFGYAQELAQTTLSGAWFWLHFEYLGIPWLPSMWLLLARKHLCLRTRNWILAIVPVFSTITEWTNDLHHYFDASARLVQHGSFWIVEVQRGPVAWFNLAYLYFCVFYGVWLYLRAFRTSSAFFRIQTGVFVSSSLPPLLGNALYLSGYSPWGLDLAPVAMALSTVFAYIAVFDLECFDLVPMARSQVFRNMRDAVLVTDMHHRLVDFNPAAISLFPCLHSSALGRPIEEILRCELDFQSLVSQKGWPANLEIELSGEPHSFETSVLPLGEPNYQTGWAMILADITDQLRLMQELQRHAETDALTGIANRRHFSTVVEREFIRMTRHPASFSLILLDVDRFKSINDSFGHGVGDHALRTITRHIESCLRASDTLSRLGGDEFAILLPQTALDPAVEVAERIRSTVAECPIPTEDGPISVTLSLGVASFEPASPRPWREILDDADRALYQAKARGRNQVARFTPDEQEEQLSLYELE